MIIFKLLQLAITIVSTLLTPFTMVSNIFGNFLQDTGFVALLKFSTFFFSSATLGYLLATLVFWFSIFTIRPLVNFVRNRG